MQYSISRSRIRKCQKDTRSERRIHLLLFEVELNYGSDAPLAQEVALSERMQENCLPWNFPFFFPFRKTFYSDLRIQQLFGVWSFIIAILMLHGTVRDRISWTFHISDVSPATVYSSLWKIQYESEASIQGRSTRFPRYKMVDASQRLF